MNDSQQRSGLNDRSMPSLPSLNNLQQSSGWND